MDPLSISASIAGLIALTSGLIKLADTLRNSFKEEVLQLVTSVLQDIELLYGILQRIQTWADSVQTNGKGHDHLVNLSPFVSNCTNHVKKIGGQLLALEEVAKKRGFKKLCSVVNVNERMKDLEVSRVALGQAKTTLLLALSAKNQDISSSLEDIQTKLETIYQNIANSNPNDPDLNAAELDGPQSFEDWLQKFANNDQDDQLAEYRLRKQKQRQQDREAAAWKASHDTNKIYVKVANLRSRDGETVTETLLLERSANIIDIILQLHEQGYEDVCGFETADGSQKYGPFEAFNASTLVRVRSGPSSYDLRTGLWINENERLVDFFNSFLDNQAPKEAGAHLPHLTVRRMELSQGLKVVDSQDREHSELAINFNRCQRVPADGEVYDPPAPFGSFPVLAVSDFKDKLPLDMREKGGYFFPMLQREALGLQFTAQRGCPKEAFAVKLHTGAINTVTGKKALDQTSKEQDFIVTPRQKRLDGVKADGDQVQQFVAMPLSWGYSVEKQVTGLELIGGMQLQIAPKLRTSVTFNQKRNQHPYLGGRGNCKFDIFKSPRDLGLSSCYMDQNRDDWIQIKCDEAVSKNLHDKLAAKEDKLYIIRSFLKSSLRSRFAYELGSHIQGPLGTTPQTAVTLNLIEPIVMKIKYYGKPADSDSADDSADCRFSPFLDFRDFVSIILEKFVSQRTKWKLQSISINGKDLEDLFKYCKNRIYAPIHELISPGTVLITHIDNLDEDLAAAMQEFENQLKSERKIQLRGHNYKGLLAMLRTSKNTRKTTEMAIGVQGNIRQRIKKTRHPELWRWERSKFINVQIINAVVFQKITGLSYTCPLPMRMSHKPPREKGSRPEIQQKSVYKTITDIDAGEEIKLNINLGQGEYKIGCACCERNFCDTVIQPCNHVFCSDCIESVMMTPTKGLICDVCGIQADEKISFAAKMELPVDPPFEVPGLEKTDMGINIIGHLSPPYSFDAENPSEVTLEDIAPIAKAFELLLPGKILQDFPNPGHYIHWVSSQPDILTVLITKLLGLSLGQRISLLCQIFDAGQSIPLEDWQGKYNPDVRSKIQHKFQAFLRLVPDSSDMVGQLKDILRPSQDNARWLYMHFEYVFQWMTRSPPSISKLELSVLDYLRISMPRSAIDVMVDYLVSQKTAVSRLNSYLLSLQKTENVNYAIERLAAIGADINAQDDDGNTIFHISNLWNEEKSSYDYGPDYNKEIRRLGGRIDILNKQLDSPFHLVVRHKVCQHKFENLCTDQLAKNIVNQKNKEGHTPWHIYFASNVCRSLLDELRYRGRATQAILELGADPSIPLPQEETWVKKAVKEGIWRVGRDLTPEMLKGWVDDQIYNEYLAWWNEPEQHEKKTGLEGSLRRAKSRKSLILIKYEMLALFRLM